MPVLYPRIVFVRFPPSEPRWARTNRGHVCTRLYGMYLRVFLRVGKNVNWQLRGATTDRSGDSRTAGGGGRDVPVVTLRVHLARYLATTAFKYRVPSNDDSPPANEIAPRNLCLVSSLPHLEQQGLKRPALPRAERSGGWRERRRTGKRAEKEEGMKTILRYSSRYAPLELRRNVRSNAVYNWNRYRTGAIG